MNDKPDIVVRLRASLSYWGNLRSSDVIEAADTIEALRAENARLTKINEQLCDEHNSMVIENARLRDKLKEDDEHFIF